MKQAKLIEVPLDEAGKLAEAYINKKEQIDLLKSELDAIEKELLAELRRKDRDHIKINGIRLDVEYREVEKIKARY